MRSSCEIVSNDRGVTLIEVVIAAGLMTFLTLASVQLVKMYKVSQVKGQAKITMGVVDFRLRKLIEKSSRGLDLDAFDTEIFYSLSNGGTYSRDNAKGSIANPGVALTNTAIDDTVALVGVFSSFNFVSTFIDNTGVKFSKNYTSVCIPIADANKPITHADFKQKYKKRPFLRKNGDNNNIYCCDKSNPSCTGEDARLAHDKSKYVSRIVVIPTGVDPTDTLQIIPTSGELKDVTGVGVLIFRSKEDSKRLNLLSYVYTSTCFNQRVLTGFEKKDCTIYFKKKFNISAQTFDQQLGSGVNDLGSNIGI